MSKSIHKKKEKLNGNNLKQCLILFQVLMNCPTVRLSMDIPLVKIGMNKWTKDFPAKEVRFHQL